uniref:Olfactory receptor C family, b1 n=1 Tax=Scleropages formosus TaxID=113540 RepID=A0A8C9QYF2_SCLFO
VYITGTTLNTYFHVIFLSFILQSFVQASAVIYTIDVINDSGFLPGVRLGYIVCDDCSYPIKALQVLQYLLSDPLNTECSNSSNPLVKAVVGARFSEVSITVARFLGLYMVPEISTSSSADILDDKLRFPSFLRIIPSDVYQTQAIAKFMSFFDWDWVGVVYGDDDYGRSALQSFLMDAGKAKVCVAYQEVVPHYLNNANTDQRIKEVAETIRSSTAQVVLVILKEELVRQLFEEIIRTNSSRIWIASDAWSLAQPLTRIPGINNVGEIFGFSFAIGQNPGFSEFLQNLQPGPGAVNHFIEEYKNLRFEYPQQANDDFLIQSVYLNVTFGERLTVWAIAHALRNLLQCNGTHCPGEKNFPPWMVRRYGMNIYIYSFKSKCSTPCPAGKFMKISNVSCCFICTPCDAGTFSNVSNMANCLPCPNNTWSRKGWDQCTLKNENFFGWNEPYAIVLLTFVSLGTLLLLVVFTIFLLNRHSPIVQIAREKLYYTMMASLLVSFGSVVLFMGEPNVHICRARQTMYGLSFTLCVSCILVKALHTFVNSSSFDRNLKPIAIIVVFTTVQVLICTFWLVFDSPRVETIPLDQNMIIWLQCNEGQGVGFGIMLSYIGLLAFICIWVAFKGRKVPHRFNETGYIIFSMVIYLLVWICFIPIYVTKNEHRSDVQASAILVSNYGIIFSHFLPKCYMILCKKNETTRDIMPNQSSEFSSSRDMNTTPKKRPLKVLQFKDNIQSFEKVYIKRYF